MATTPALFATVKTDQVADIAFTAAIVSNLDQGGPGRSEAVVEVHKENLVDENRSTSTHIRRSFFTWGSCSVKAGKKEIASEVAMLTTMQMRRTVL